MDKFWLVPRLNYSTGLVVYNSDFTSAMMAQSVAEVAQEALLEPEFGSGEYAQEVKNG